MAVEPPPAKPPRRTRGRVERWIIGALVALLLILSGSLVWLDSSSGHRFIAARIGALKPVSGLQITVGRIEGSIYSKAVLHDVRLADPQGVFLSAPRVMLDWFPLAWLSNRLDIDSLIIPQARLHKMPRLNPSKVPQTILPDFDIRLMELRVDRLSIDKGVTGKAQVATLTGKADIRSGRAIIGLKGRVLNGSDAIILTLDSRPDDNRFDVDAVVNAPKGGLVATMAGLKQDANIRVQGEGDWSKWKGNAVATLDSEPFIALALEAADGNYDVSGTIEGRQIAGSGLVARLTEPRLQLVASGTFEKRVLAGGMTLSTNALDLAIKGGIDLGKSRFDDLRADLILRRPDVLLKGMAATGLVTRARLHGAFDSAGFDYLLAAKQLAFGKTVLVDVRAQGSGRVGQDNGPTLIPVALTARQVSGQGVLVDQILRNLRLDGVLQVKDSMLTSNPMQLRTDKIRGQLIALADFRTGRYDLGLTGDLKDLLIPGFGIVDVNTRVQAVPGAKGSFTLTGKALAVIRRLDNAFLAGLAGGLPRATSNLSLGPDGQLQFTGLTLQAPLINLTARGFRRPDGSVFFEGSGRHATYGPLQLTLDGMLERPAVTVLLASPLDAAGLKNVRAVLTPDAQGYRYTAAGGSLLGPFTSTGAILLPRGGIAVIDVQRLDVSNTVARGQLRPVGSNLSGRLDVSGGLTGFVALQPVNGMQQIVTELKADRATFAGSPGISVRAGTLNATMLLDPAGTTIDATVQARGISRGALRIGRLAANARLVDGRGTIRGSASGQRGRLFDLQGEAQVSPGEYRIMASGTLDRRPIRIVNAAVITQTADGWRMAPATIRYMNGTAQISGRLGGSETRIEARLSNMPLATLDLYNEQLGLSGLATGTFSYARLRASAPTGSAQLRIRGLSRTGLVLSSRPVDVGVNAILTASSAVARAVISSDGKIIGRAQGKISPLGSGDLITRLNNAPVFGQLRYNGTADTLWRLTGVEIFDLSGPVALAADMRGTLANPQISGSLASDNARVESPITGMVLTGVKARGRFSGAQLVLSSFSGNAKGGGTVTGSGRFDISAERGVGISMDIQAQRATLLDRDDIGATVTGPIQIRSDGNGGLISGDLDLVQSRFTLGRAAAVAEIPELRVIEVNRRGEEFESEAAPSPWRLAIKANARNRLAVNGLGLDSEWRANLDIGGTVTSPAILGTATLVRGGYEFAGRRFDLTEGDIRFDGRTPVNPTLNIEAEASISDLNATIRVTGTGLAPEISFSSVPALPEDELLSRLLFGSSITTLSAPEALQLAAAVAALQGGGGGLDPINAVRKSIGLDRLRIIAADPISGQGTALAAGKYITRRTYVELISDGQGYSATKIEFQITRWLALLATISTVGRQSTNVRISKDY